MSRAIKGLHHIATSSNGAEVFVDLISSPAADRISHQPHILSLAKELLSTRELTGENLKIEHGFGRVVGNSEVVETTERDVIVYAKRLKRDTYSRFVRKRQLMPSKYLSMTLKRIDDNTYCILDMWFGRLIPQFPTEATQNTASKFWENHAIVLEGQALQLRTVTKEFPF